MAKAVFFGGKLVAEDGRLIAPVEEKSFEIEKQKFHEGRGSGS